MINYVHAQKSLIEEFSKFLKLEITFADSVQMKLQAIAKSIQSEMFDMQNSVLSIRNFFNRKAPFMIRDFTNVQQNDYDSVTQKVRRDVLDFMFGPMHTEDHHE
jgi:hypothetical protein